MTVLSLVLIIVNIGDDDAFMTDSHSYKFISIYRYEFSFVVISSAI